MFYYILGKPPSTFINNVNIKNEKVNKNTILEELIEDMDIKDDIFKKEFKNILNSYSDVIVISIDDLESSLLLLHHIELLNGSSKPIKQKAYSISQIQLEALKEELRKLIDKGLIAPSHSPWS